MAGVKARVIDWVQTVKSPHVLLGSHWKPTEVGIRDRLTLGNL